MSYKGLHRGPWAGDRFDIVRLQTFEREVEAQRGSKFEDWKDVTEEVKASSL